MLKDGGSGEAEASGAMSESDHDYDDTDLATKDEDDTMTEQNQHTDGAESSGEGPKKFDRNDPKRPRRKKARRACYACQRAHLTCGDERPCQRCIKRGLMDSCQDGVRKKAKYLHDAPPEALRPVLGPIFNPDDRPARHGHRHGAGSVSDTSPTVGSFYSQASASQYPIYSSVPAPMTTVPESLPFGSQPSPVSPSFTTSGNPSIGALNGPPASSPMGDFNNPLFDPLNPAIFNFNLEGLTFGSQYGAMEFGILGHMSSGAADTPPQEGPLPQQGGDVPYGASGGFGNGLNRFDKPYDGSVMHELLGMDSNGSGGYAHGNLQHGLPHAYAIPAGPTSLQSPSTENNSPQPTTLAYDGSPNMGNYSATPGKTGTAASQPPRSVSKSALARLNHQSILGKRQRDPSVIYESVKEPFGYVTSFHKLFSLIQNRFSAAHMSRIAQSLASIRPSLLSSTRNLTRQDLVFMEKSFQRCLFEYEEFMHHTSSPTLACRRTGEVAGVNKEFTALTGWTKDVLLGKEPNLNVNVGGSGPSGDANSAKGPIGLQTPRLRALAADSPEGPRPVFLAELLDHESVAEFYEDYAQLAFNDSRSTVVRKCRLLKYRTQEKADGASASGGSGSTTSTAGAGGGNDGKSHETSPVKDPRNSILSNRVAKIDGEHGISKLEKDGKLECSYTWTIKRDTFDIPMVIVINFLPCYYRNHNQLAV